MCVAKDGTCGKCEHWQRRSVEYGVCEGYNDRKGHTELIDAPSCELYNSNASDHDDSIAFEIERKMC